MFNIDVCAFFGNTLYDPLHYNKANTKLATSQQ